MTCFVLLMSIQDLSGQKLPVGASNSIRERTYDIVHFKADLEFDLKAGSLAGDVAVTANLLAAGSTFTLDAYYLDVSAVTLGAASTPLTFKNDNHQLLIQLPRAYKPEESFTVTISYAASPRAGMMFQSDWADTNRIYVHTYGEGGMHANWLPIYNDINDKFTSEMIITVPVPNVVISNGNLVDQQESGGSRTYHYRQDKVHSNYLIAVYIGEFESGSLEPAFGEIPINYWVPVGRLAEGAYAFRNTTRMVEHYSNLLGYRYPWVKYDQIAVPDYAIGAMEHTGVTGHSISVLRKPGEHAPLDFGGPVFTEYSTDWSAEATISHELAHHWFGDNLTCASLGYIWLNESFASYMMMLWDEESVGQEQLDYDVLLAKRHYTEYVSTEHLIRPLEYHYYDAPSDIYNTEHTYLKGGVILHMLRIVMGDEAFFNGLQYYLKQHEFDNVVSEDLHQALEESSSLDLDWFFDEWVNSGGHPQFEITYAYHSKPGLIDLEVAQIQPIVEGQDLFHLPVDITISAGGKTWTEQILVGQATEHFIIKCATKPDMVSFDGDGALVAEVSFDKSADELAFQATNDALAGRFRAINSLAIDYPKAIETYRTFSRILNTDAYWADQAEVASLTAHLDERKSLKLIKSALKNTDYRVRKGAVIALGQFESPAARKLLSRVVKSESHPDVLATAINHSEYSIRMDHLDHQAWYDEITIGALEGLIEIEGDAGLGKVASMTARQYNMDVRRAAMRAWLVAAPDDPALHALVESLAMGGPYPLQKDAITLSGELGLDVMLPFLEGLVEQKIDPNLTKLAKEAMESISRLALLDE
ncbi:M1 family aminopeptidase [Candidatus Neomarinimicrobiota bacterium]